MNSAILSVLFFLALFFGFIILIIIIRSFRILNEYERGVIFRLGKFSAVKGPGLIILIPILDRMVKVSLRTVALDVPSQDIITKDNTTIRLRW